MDSLPSYKVSKGNRGRGRYSPIHVDHVYEVAILKNIVKASKGPQKLYPCLDRLIRGRNAVEGLKIVVSGETIVLSGKDIPFVPRCSFSLVHVYSLHLGTFSSSTPSLVALLPPEQGHGALG